MAEHRTRKSKETPHYGFLVSWQPSTSTVKGESKISHKLDQNENRHLKNADILAQEVNSRSIKKDIIKSLISISLILCLELVIYLAWNKLRV